MYTQPVPPIMPLLLRSFCVLFAFFLRSFCLLVAFFLPPRSHRDEGGIYVKLGQLISTIGAGVFEEAYIDALAPLQDGVPPRSLSEISDIIEKDVGMPMSSIFMEFEETPVGAASVAQAHRAKLLDGRDVIVKVQYPEVAQHYKADFDNLEALAAWLTPENVPLVQGLRRRHEGELDFRHEVGNRRGRE